MKKKKVTAILMGVLIALAATGCSLVPQEAAATPAPTQAASPVPESSMESSEPIKEESSAESSVASSGEAASSKGSESSGGTDAGTNELPAAVGDPAFIEAFTGNEIDTAYLDAIGKAVSVADMTQAANTATAAWETQINYGFTLLTDALEGEAKENETLEQSAWSNELNIAKKEITDSAEGQGSAANLDVSYKIMLLYRSRAMTIFEKLYVVTGEVKFHQITGEAVG